MLLLYIIIKVKFTLKFHWNPLSNCIIPLWGNSYLWRSHRILLIACSSRSSQQSIPVGTPTANVTTRARIPRRRSTWKILRVHTHTQWWTAEKLVLSPVWGRQYVHRIPRDIVCNQNHITHSRERRPSRVWKSWLLPDVVCYRVLMMWPPSWFSIFHATLEIRELNERWVFRAGSGVSRRYSRWENYTREIMDFLFASYCSSGIMVIALWSSNCMTDEACIEYFAFG